MAYGISQADLEQITLSQANGLVGLASLLNGAAQAFYTSIAGLICSLIFTRFQHEREQTLFTLITTLNQTLEAAITPISNEMLLCGIGDNAKRQLDCSEHMASDFVLKFNDLFDTIIKQQNERNAEVVGRIIDSIDKIEKGISAMSSSQAAQVGDLVTRAVDSFGTSLETNMSVVTSSFTESAKGVNSTVASLDGLMHNLEGCMTNSAAEIAKTIDGLQSSIGAIQASIAKSAEDIAETVATLRDDIRMDAERLGENVATFTDRISQVSSELDQSAQKTSSAANEFSETMTRSGETLTSSAAKAGDCLTASAEAAGEKLIDASDKAGEALASRVSAALPKFDSMAEKLTTASNALSESADRTTTAAGGFAEAMDKSTDFLSKQASVAGSVLTMQLESAGGKLMDSTRDAGDLFAQTIGATVPKLTDFTDRLTSVSEALQASAAKTAEASEKFVASVSQSGEALLGHVNTAGDALESHAGKAGDKLVESSAAAGDKLIEKLAGPKLAAFGDKIDTVSTRLAETAQATQTAAQGFADAVGQSGKDLVGHANAAGDALETHADKAGEKLVEASSAAGDAIVAKLTGPELDGLHEEISSIAETLTTSSKATQAAASGFAEAMRKSGEILAAHADIAGGSLEKHADKAGETLITASTSAGKILADRIGGALPLLESATQSIADAARTTTAFKDLLAQISRAQILVTESTGKISLLAREMKAATEQIQGAGAGIGKALEGGIAQLGQTQVRAAGQISSQVNHLLDRISQMNSIQQGLTDDIKQIHELTVSNLKGLAGALDAMNAQLSNNINVADQGLGKAVRQLESTIDNWTEKQAEEIRSFDKRLESNAKDISQLSALRAQLSDDMRRLKITSLRTDR